ncbi:MAG: hypothetical protein ACTSU5_19855 [Promethearchaeota archaeon]
MADEETGGAPETRDDGSSSAVEGEWKVLVKAYKKLDEIQEEISDNPDGLPDASDKVKFLESLEKGIEKLREHIVAKYVDDPGGD